MNNNFSFNYNKINEERQKLVEVEQIENKDNNYNYNSNNNNNNQITKERKIKIIIILVVGFTIIFALFAIFSANSSSFVEMLESYDKEQDNNLIQKEEDNNLNNQTDNENINISLNKNYTIEAIIDYKIKNKDYHYQYNVQKEDEKLYIIKQYNDLLEKYYYENFEYFLVTSSDEANNDVYTLVNETTVYDILPKKYIDINTLLFYLEKGNKLYTTVHEDGKKEMKYEVLLENILTNNKSSEKIDILFQTQNNYIFEINLLNLMKLYDPNYENYNLKITYENIN